MYGILLTCERRVWNSSQKAWLPKTTMKEDLIGEGSTAELQTSAKTVKSQRSVVFSMVHIIAVGLPLVVIWLAQPGTSKLSKDIPSSIKLIHSVLQ